VNDLSTSALVALAIYCAVVLLASLAGGWLLLALHLTHARLQAAVSFVAGLMLGMALLHFIPHSYHQNHALDQTMGYVLAGFLVMFFLQRFFHYHHHDVSKETGEEGAPHYEPVHNHDADCLHLHHEHAPTAKPARPLSWLGTLAGLSLHSLLDGAALAAAVAADTHGHGGLLGLGAALAIVLHKPFDAMAIGTLMSASGCSRSLRHAINGLFALVAPLGVAVFLLGLSQFGSDTPAILGGALAFCAGTFLCVACTDLLPELQFHSHDRLKLSLGLAAGLGVAILIGQFESSGHDHDQPETPPAQTQAR
jgi:zinc and cadmium transporter